MNKINLIRCTYYLMIQNDYPQAMRYIQAYKQQVGKIDNNLKFINGVSCYLEGNLAASVKIFDEIYDYLLENCTADFKWWRGTELISSLLVSNDLDRCRDYFDRYLVANPQDTLIMNEIGLLHYMQQDYAAAIAVYLKALELTPENVQLLINAGLAYVKLGIQKEALLFFEKAVDLDDAVLSNSHTAVNEIIKMLFERTGECNFCAGRAMCCKNVRLSIHNGCVDSEEKYRQVVACDQRNESWVYSSTDENGHWRFDCRYITAEGKCSIYSSRPQICMDFPSQPFQLSKNPQCSYRFVVREDKTEFSSINAVRKILEFLQAEGKWQEHAILKEQIPNLE